MREGRSSASERLLGHESPVPGGFITDSVWVCWPVDAGAEVSCQPHGAFPTWFLSTSPLSVRPRAGCLQDKSPACACTSAQSNRRCGLAAVDPKGCSPFRLCTHRFPQLPMAPTCGLSPTSPHASWAMDVLAGCLLGRWQKPGAIWPSSRDTPKVGCNIWKPFFCPVRVANTSWAAEP